MIMISVFLVVIPIILVIALFMRKGIDITTSIDINKPQQQVFDYIVLLKNQEHYNAWLMVDPKMNKTYTGTDGTLGFILAWESKNKTDGKAHMQIAEIVVPQKITVDVVFEKPVPSKARFWLELAAINNMQTRVTFTYEGNPAPYYLLRVSQMTFRLKRRVTGYMQASLVNLKNILEH